MAEWHKRDWGAFCNYFEGTYLDSNQLTGWQAKTLGVGAPSTNNGLEGSWPTIHRLICGIVSELRMLELLQSVIVQHYQRNTGEMSSKRRDLVQSQRQEATAIALLGLVISSQQSENELFYCHYLSPPPPCAKFYHPQRKSPPSLSSRSFRSGPILSS